MWPCTLWWGGKQNSVDGANHEEHEDQLGSLLPDRASVTVRVPTHRLSSDAQVLFLAERIELGGVGDRGRILLRKWVAR